MPNNAQQYSSQESQNCSISWLGMGGTVKILKSIANYLFRTKHSIKFIKEHGDKIDNNINNIAVLLNGKSSLFLQLCDDDKKPACAKLEEKE